jgi:rhodanese-related sulfurtransferase
MPITELSVANAHAHQQQGATIVDVRSTSEYAAGHPAGALNVPLLEHDEDTGELVPNPDFVRVMQANFAPDTALLLSCRSGARSMRAAQMLEAFGYASLANVTGGFSGSQTGIGWADAGLPVEIAPTAHGSYAELLEKADS